MTEVDVSKLAAEFPKGEIHWRAQTLTRNGDKALALAYLDARDVMERLDEVCGPENWQDTYTETARGRVIATIKIRFGDEWIGKSDGAGDTAVEGEKGGISDAFKRAAVKWGIGRYLYDLDAVWVPCETYEKGGKKFWAKWTADPWQCVRGKSAAKAQEPQPETKPKAQSRELYTKYEQRIRAAGSQAELESIWDEASIEGFPKDFEGSLVKEINTRLAELKKSKPVAEVPPNFDDMPAETQEALGNYQAG